MSKKKSLPEMRDMLERLEENGIDAYVNQCVVEGSGDLNSKECRDLAENLMIASSKAEEFKFRADQSRRIGESLINLGNSDRGNEYLERADLLEQKASNFEDKMKRVDYFLDKKKCKEAELLRRIMS